jgi:hypothetical protein
MTPETSPNRPQFFRGGPGPFRTPNAGKPLSQSDRHGLCHRLASLFRKPLRQLMRFRIFDIQAHHLPRYHIVYLGGFYHAALQTASDFSPNFGQFGLKVKDEVTNLAGPRFP